MGCHLFGNVPSSESLLTGHLGTNSNEIWIKIKQFCIRKWISKCPCFFNMIRKSIHLSPHASLSFHRTATIITWIVIYIHSFIWDVLTHPCTNIKGVLIKPSLKLRYSCIITSHCFAWMQWLLRGILSNIFYILFMFYLLTSYTRFLIGDITCLNSLMRVCYFCFISSVTCINNQLSPITPVAQ